MANEDLTKPANSTSERNDRLKKLDEIKNSGANPYPDKSSRTHSIIEALARFL